MTSFSSVPMAAATRLSFLERSMASRPLERTEAKASTATFLASPMVVAMMRKVPGLKTAHRDDGRHLFRRVDGEEVDHGRALGDARDVERDLVALDAEDAALVGEEEHGVVRVGGQQEAHGVLFAGRHADDAAPAAVLQGVGLGRHALDEAALGEGDHHVLVGDEVFLGEAQRLLLGDIGDAGVAELGPDALGLFFDQAVDAAAGWPAGLPGRRWSF